MGINHPTPPSSGDVLKQTVLEKFALALPGLPHDIQMPTARGMGKFHRWEKGPGTGAPQHQVGAALEHDGGAPIVAMLNLGCQPAYANTVSPNAFGLRVCTPR